MGGEVVGSRGGGEGCCSRTGDMLLAPRSLGVTEEEVLLVWWVFTSDGAGGCLQRDDRGTNRTNIFGTTRN